MRFKSTIHIAACIALAFGMFGCQKAEVSPDSVQNESEKTETVFTLNATIGSPDTKLSFDEDGLGTTWQPGDKLYLVDVAGVNSTVTLTTSITEASKTASFSSTQSVLSGDYVVLYGRSVLTSVNLPITLTDLDNLKDRLWLYGTLSVSDGQTSANLSLKHSQAKLSFKFKNTPAGLTNMSSGVAVSTGGVKYSSTYTISSNGIGDSSAYQYFMPFGWNNGYDSATLIPPADWSGKKVYFYVYGTDANNNHVTYEFVKDGINLSAGVNYNITLDFSTATMTTLTPSSSVYSLNSPADFRAAAYWNTTKSYSLGSDVDFTGEQYFPIYASSFNGNKHTLSNITIDFEKCNNVGILSKCTSSVYDLIVKNISVKGGDYIGAVVGNASCDINSCSTKGDNIVKGNNYVGGLCGYSLYAAKECYIIADVSGTNYVGGVLGYNGFYSVEQCSFEGSVTGATYVGGLIGEGCQVSKCYVKGSVNGGSYVGGIVGYYPESSVYDSYIIGDVIGTGSNVGGILGYSSYYPTIEDCYSYGTVSSGYGIYGSGNFSDKSKNLTSSNSLSSYYSSSSYPDNCNFGPDKPFLASLSVINGNEAYSTQVWKDIDAQCPLLQWQSDTFGGDTDAPGFGDEDW